jgi:hypothetical protein
MILTAIATAIGWMVGVGWVVFTILCEGFVIVQLWRWFAVPLGVPAITLPHAIGLNVLIQIFTWRFVPSEPAHVWRRMGEWAVMCAVVLSVGFIASRFM